MKLNISSNTEALYQAFAQFFVKCAQEAIVQSNKFSVALSGGSSPKKLYELLASDAYRNQIDWTKVYFFYGDERYVEHTHPDSNYLMSKNAFLDTLDIKDNQVFKVDTSLDPASAAIDYERCIRHFFNGNPSFDLILLGLGDDAHTASLFPGTSILWIDEELVKEVYLQDKEVYRISMTAPLINQAKNVAFFTFGANKANAIQAVLEADKDINQYPAQLIEPKNGELQWFVDEAAVARLRK
ncbi:6-phosphogluconolactonase [Pelobium sp.]|nr:6-phosphogluconolactonase [Pelobium sp.]MDA9555645.1 6-phosphogluconolactonase [Pelobium sp.]